MKTKNNSVAKPLEEWKTKLLALSGEERWELGHFLLDSLDETANEPMTADEEKQWLAELRRRSEEVRSGKVKARPVREVLAEFKEKYP